MRAVHYLNQFFAGLGGEEAAGHAPARIEGAVGPGRGLGLDVAATLACGDDYFGEHEAEALARLLELLEADQPDVLVLGPAFGSGRYGYACGSFAREAARRGIPAVAAMHPDNPGVLAAGAAYVVPTGAGVSDMRATLPRLAALARRLAAGEPLGPAADEGFLPRAYRRNVLAERTGAARALDLLLAKLAGRTGTEIETDGARVAPPPSLARASDAVVALVTEAGCVPRGNPGRLPTRRSHAWLEVPLDGVQTLSPERFETVHAGFDTTAANGDPNRLVPLDAVRSLEREGRVGRLHEVLYTTSGVDTPVPTAARHGQEIAGKLEEAGVDAVILTGT